LQFTYFFGNEIVTIVGHDFIETVPPCCSIMLLTHDNPNPVPSCFVVNNGSKILHISSSDSPFPESCMVIITGHMTEEIEKEIRFINNVKILHKTIDVNQLMKLLVRPEIII